MDREWPIEKRRRFIEVAARHPAGRGIHDLRTRSSGTHEFAQFHIWLDPEMTVADAHEVIEEIESRAERRIPRLRGAHPPRPRRPASTDPGQRPRSKPIDHQGKPDTRMTELRLVQVDAFADRPFTGNPAAVMPLDAWLPDEMLQAIAEENNLSETAFTIPAEDGEADYELRWFTPAVEVVLCGHATLASGHVLIGERDRIRFRTRRAGMLEVARDGDGYAMSLPAWKAEPKPLPEVLAALGCDARETLWHPGRYALDRARQRSRRARASGRISALWPRRATSSPSSPRPATPTDMVSRVFAAGAGIDEDPVTGSAHCISVPYWAGRLGKDALTCFQASARSGHLTGRLEGDRVILGGKCVTVLEGVMRI